MHTHPNKFTYKPSKRTHGRPPRIFVICSECGREFQAIKNHDGSIHTFTTNAKRSDRKVRSFRLSDAEYEKVKKFIKEERRIQ